VQAPKKLYSNAYACLTARHVEKFREVTPLGPKVIGAYTLNLGAIFKLCLLKIVWGETFVFGLVWVSKP